MASDRVPTDIRVEEVSRPIQLWVEAQLLADAPVRRPRPASASATSCTNVSNQNMVLAEQEFDRETGSVLGVAIENHNLRPGESTAVYVIRQGA